MIWGSPGRQHTWLAVGARTFALLSLAMPLILKNNQLLLLALLAIGAIWAAVTAGELLGLPATLLLVLDSAPGRLGRRACRPTRRPPSSARSPSRRSPPACSRGAAGRRAVAVGRAHGVRRGRA